LTAADNGTPVQKLQTSLLDAGEVLPKFGADGKWGSETSAAIVSFQRKNGIPPGGFEAGRKTLLALDLQLQQKPKPPPPSQPKLDAPQCDKKIGDTIPITGSGFPPGSTVFLSVDGIPGNSALAQTPSGAIAGSISAGQKSGSHVVEATTNGVRA